MEPALGEQIKLVRTLVEIDSIRKSMKDNILPGGSAARTNVDTQRVFTIVDFNNKKLKLSGRITLQECRLSYSMKCHKTYLLKNILILIALIKRGPQQMVSMPPCVGHVSHIRTMFLGGLQ